MQAKGQGIWVVAANRNGARLFQAATETAPILVAETIANPDADAAERELHRHDAGRSTSSATGRHTRLEPRQAGKEAADEAFARSVAARIEAIRAAGGLGRLYLVADPGMLGALRGALTKDSARLVAGEIRRDPGHDDETALRALLPKTL